MTFEEWVAQGVGQGWVTLPMCATHTYAPLRDWENDLLYAGDDPCILVMRVWKDGMEDFEP